MNQFSIITELLGTPPDDVIETICSENVRQTLMPYVRSRANRWCGLDAPLRTEPAKAPAGAI